MLVPKKDRKLRMCVDFRDVNKACCPSWMVSRDITITMAPKDMTKLLSPPNRESFVTQ